MSLKVCLCHKIMRLMVVEAYFVNDVVEEKSRIETAFCNDMDDLMNLLLMIDDR